MADITLKIPSDKALLLIGILENAIGQGSREAVAYWNHHHGNGGDQAQKVWNETVEICDTLREWVKQLHKV